VNMCPVN